MLMFIRFSALGDLRPRSSGESGARVWQGCLCPRFLALLTVMACGAFNPWLCVSYVHPGYQSYSAWSAHWNPDRHSTLTCSVSWHPSRKASREALLDAPAGWQLPDGVRTNGLFRRSAAISHNVCSYMFRNMFMLIPSWGFGLGLGQD